jgi:hypothetical protein
VAETLTREDREHQPALGTGLYSLSELSRYLSLPLTASPSKVLRWFGAD